MIWPAWNERQVLLLPATGAKSCSARANSGSGGRGPDGGGVGATGAMAGDGAGVSGRDGRRRRRVELARGWKFKCECERCVAEVVQDITKEDEELGVKKDESKVENVMRHERLPGANMTPD